MSSYDNNSDPGTRRNRGGKFRQRDRDNRRRDDDDRHNESSGKGGNRDRHQDFEGRNRREGPPDYADAASAASERSQRQQNRQRFLSGNSGGRGTAEYPQTVPPPPPPPQVPQQGQYNQPCPVSERRQAHSETYGHGQRMAMPHVAPTMPQMPGPRPSGPNAFLATGPVPMPGAMVPGPVRSRDEVTKLIRESCQANDLAKAIAVLRSFEDEEREQILPVVLEDLLMASQELQNRTVALKCEDAAEVIYQLGKVGTWGQHHQQLVQDLSKAISDHTKYRTEELTPFAISRMVWGFTCLCARSDPLMSVVAAEVVKKIKGFKHQELANTAWAFAKCGLWNEQLAQSIAQQCYEGIKEFSTDSLSNVAWAMAQWSSKDETLLRTMSEELMQKPETYEPQPMATLAWAFSTLSFRPENLLKNILSESARKISQFNIKEIAHLAWSFANLRVSDQNLYQKIAEHIHMQQNLQMQPAEIANIAWAFAKNQLANQVIMNRLAQEAVTQIGGFKATEITMLTWAYAVSNMGPTQLMLEIGTKVSQRSQKFTAGQLAHIIWAFGALTLKHGGLCDAVAKCCQADMARGNTQSPSGGADFFGIRERDRETGQNANTYNANGLTQVVWGFAMVQYRNTQFLHEAASHICRGIDMLKPLALWRCASAYNAMMVNNKEIKGAILVEACKKQQEFSLKGLSRLLDCYSMHTGQIEQENLERVVDERLKDVAQKLHRLYTSGGFPYEVNVADPEIYQWLMDSGFLDLQMQGMKKILQKLQIQTPPWTFVSKCFRDAKQQQFWRSQAFGMAELHVRGQSHWMARTLENNQDEGTIKRLTMEVFQSATPDCQVLRHILELSCGMLMDNSNHNNEQLAKMGQIEGTLHILLSLVPSSNSIALLLQFRAKFPKIHLHFVEINVNAQILSNYIN